jgi:peroxiredoxin
VAAGDGEVPGPHGPTRQAWLLEGCGQVRFPITCDRELTQQFFDQGIAQLHDHWFVEAERSFRQVAALEPGCAMAFWGAAMANVDRPARAAWFLEKALQRRERAGPHEQAWIDLLAGYYELAPAGSAGQGPAAAPTDSSGAAIFGADGQRLDGVVDDPYRYPARSFRAGAPARRARLTTGLRSIAAARPDDIDAVAFLADCLWRRGQAGDAVDAKTVGDTLRRLEALLLRHPRHPAHHVRMLLRTGDEPARALKSVAFTWRTAPAAPAPWNAAAGVLASLGRHEDASWYFEAAIRVDHAHMERHRLLPYQVPGYAGRLAGLCQGLLATGHPDHARRAHELAEAARTVPRHPRHNDPADADSIAATAEREAARVAAAGGVPGDYGEGMLSPVHSDAAPATTPALAPADIGRRPDLEALGPPLWHPPLPYGWTLPDSAGRPHRLADHRGRPVLVVLYLGFGCLHCVEQLQGFRPLAADFGAAGIDMVAIGLDTVAGTRRSVTALGADAQFPFPLLSDRKLRVFREWLAFDEFETTPLHGTYLIDGQGRLRWHDIGFAPFEQQRWLLAECRRLLETP